MTRVDAADDSLRIMDGPFDGLMRRLGLSSAGRRVFLVASLCWALPVLLLLATDAEGLGSFLGDWGAGTKFLLAPILLILTEKPIRHTLDLCTSIFFEGSIVASQSLPKARAELETARSHAAAGQPELVCLLLALTASAASLTSFLGGMAPAWGLSDNGLSAAGVWCVTVSNSVFWFLLARLVWKHIIWARFLSDLAECDLRLVVTHPDGHAGLGFLGFYPLGGGLFTFAASSVAAAGLAHVMEREHVTPTLFTAACVGWLATVVAYYVAPLAGMAWKIALLKRRAAIVASEKATDFERMLERFNLGENICPDAAEEQATELKDMKPLYTGALRTSSLLVNRGNLLSIIFPALLPLLFVGAANLPWSQLAPIVRRLLFL